MGNKGRKSNAITWLRGNTNDIQLPVKTVKTNECDEITVGDLIYYNLSTGTSEKYFAYPVGKLATASVQDRADRYFAGVSMSDSKDGESDNILVATTGVFEIPCASGTYYPGYVAKLVTGVGASSGSCDVDAILPAATTAAYQNTVGVVVKGGTTVTTAEVQIASKVFGGSVEYPTQTAT
jgi:hypothetical protein